MDQGNASSRYVLCENAIRYIKRLHKERKYLKISLILFPLGMMGFIFFFLFPSADLYLKYQANQQQQSQPSTMGRSRNTQPQDYQGIVQYTYKTKANIGLKGSFAVQIFAGENKFNIFNVIEDLHLQGYRYWVTYNEYQKLYRVFIEEEYQTREEARLVKDQFVENYDQYFIYMNKPFIKDLRKGENNTLPNSI